MQSRETQITMAKWTNAGGQTKRANERSFVYRPPAWRRWRNLKTTYWKGMLVLFECKCTKHENTKWRQYFYVSFCWGRNCHFTWPSEPHEGQAVCRPNAAPSFLSPAPAIKPATSRPVVKTLIYRGFVTSDTNSRRTCMEFVRRGRGGGGGGGGGGGETIKHSLFKPNQVGSHQQTLNHFII